MNHEYHHLHAARIHLVVQRNLGALGVLNQSGLNTTIKPNGSGYILQDLWYFELWVTVCDYLFEQNAVMN